MPNTPTTTGGEITAKQSNKYLVVCSINQVHSSLAGANFN